MPKSLTSQLKISSMYSYSDNKKVAELRLRGLWIEPNCSRCSLFAASGTTDKTGFAIRGSRKKNNLE